MERLILHDYGITYRNKLAVKIFSIPSFGYVAELPKEKIKAFSPLEVHN
jgi:hypothetical protein